MIRGKIFNFLEPQPHNEKINKIKVLDRIKPII